MISPSWSSAGVRSYRFAAGVDPGAGAIARSVAAAPVPAAPDARDPVAASPGERAAVWSATNPVSGREAIGV
jgi:hypothetical protein